MTLPANSVILWFIFLLALLILRLFSLTFYVILRATARTIAAMYVLLAILVTHSSAETVITNTSKYSKDNSKDTKSDKLTHYEASREKTK